jgi:glycosyltransferase involved in cell wall biosynthesis
VEEGRAPVRVVEVLRRLSRGAGIQLVVRRLAEHVDPAAVDLHVITVRGLREDDELDRLPVTVHPLGVEDRDYTLLQRVRVMSAVAHEVRAIEADVVRVHSGSAWLGLGARLLNRRTAFVLDVHDAPGSGRHSRFTDWFEGKWGQWLGAQVVCHAEPVAQEIRTHWRLAPTRLTVIPLAVDTSTFRPAPPEERARWRARHNLGESQFVLVVAGRFAPSKRFDRAVDVLGAVRQRGIDAALVIVGRGPTESILRDRAAQLGLDRHVVFAGPQWDDLPTALGACDVLCSTSSYEGFGLTLIEGMACCLPVVACSVGGVTDLVVEGETGHLVGLDDFGAFADRVCELAAQPGRSREMGEAGRRRVEATFGVDSFAKSFADLFVRLVTDPVHRR